jgi:hypothetical protein
MWSVQISSRSRWRVRVLVAVASLIAVLLLLRGFYRRELYHLAGGAQWMWVSDDVHEPRPTAGLFCRRLHLNARPARALAKVCGDRQYVLWVNGLPAAAGHNRPGFTLDVVPVTDLLNAGPNTFVIEGRSSTSVGAVIFALDLYPSAEGSRRGDPRGRNVLVSNSSWAVIEQWPEDLAEVDIEARSRPWIWGRPPDHPWTYPRPRVWERPLVQSIIGEGEPIDPARFLAGDDDLWLCDLGRPMAGYLWLEEAPDARSVSALALRSPDGLERDLVEVVRLDGQHRWLFPGLLEGRDLVVRSRRPPTGVSVVEAHPGGRR